MKLQVTWKTDYEMWGGGTKVRQSLFLTLLNLQSWLTQQFWNWHQVNNKKKCFVCLFEIFLFLKWDYFLHLVTFWSLKWYQWFSFIDDAEDCDISSMVTWLKYHNAPKERVKEMMERTCKHRASYIRDNKESSVGDIRSEYPHLIDTDGMVIVLLKTCAILLYLSHLANRNLNWSAKSLLLL